MGFFNRLWRSLAGIGRGSDRERLTDWMRVLTASVLLGFFVIILYGYSGSTQMGISFAGRVIAGGLMLAGAALLGGGLIGFLFGIPRTLQDPAAAAAASAATQNGAAPAARYVANTNLEQISDWLTKMLVGVGLTQLRDAPANLAAAAEFFAPSLSMHSDGKPFAFTIILFFVTAGFLFAYLWTRLYLARAMHVADTAGQVRSQLEARDVTDARAISLTRQQLEAPGDGPAMDIDELMRSIIGASPAVKVQIYYLASNQRRDTWRDDKQAMERTIPIFEALVESDPEMRFHKNLGQLGFAMKDKTDPDYERSRELLTQAIRSRGSWAASGWLFYEFNRAVCRIHLDEQFKNGKAASPKVREKIVADLGVAQEADNLRALFDEEPISKWIKLNSVTQDELEAAAEDSRAQA